MIQLVDQALEAFLRHDVPLAEAAIDIAFDAPDRTWGAGVNRPTVNAFLFEVRRASAFEQAGPEQRAVVDGRVQRRPPTPVVDLRYLVTAWASGYEDEHQLLGQVLRTVLVHGKIPPERFPDRAGVAGEVRVGLGGPEQRASDFWSALGGRLKPALFLDVSVPLDVFAWQETAPPTERVEVQAGPAVPRARGSVISEGRAAPNAQPAGHARQP